MEKGKKQTGYILITTLLITMMILTSSGLWMQKSAVNSALAKQMVQQKADLILINSLTPFMKSKLLATPEEELLKADDHFYLLELDGDQLWQIKRSSKISDKIILTYNSTKHPGIFHQKTIAF